MKQENKDKVIRRSLYTPTELRVRESAEGEAPSRTIVGYANIPWPLHHHCLWSCQWIPCHTEPDDGALHEE